VQYLPVRDSQRTPLSVYFSGFMITAAFYATVPFLSGVGPFVQRYFCSHPIEIGSTILFFSGMTILLHRLLRIRSERSAANAIETAAISAQGSAQGSGLAVLQQWVDDQPKNLRRGSMLERVHGAMQYVAGSGSQGLEQHLRYLAELAGDRLHQGYALVRTITWAIPILGFLGTVHGITIAIANLTPEQLDTSLPEVVGGLEAAFDTTALALAMSIVLVFTAFKTERNEQSILNIVEQFGIDHILPHFPSQKADTALSVPQAEQWQKQCLELQSVWSTTLNEHFRTLSGQLDSEVESTLKLHRATASEAQEILSATMQESAATYAEVISTSIDGLSSRVEQWERAMLTTSSSAAEQTEALHSLGRTLLQMQDSEERLTTLQAQLNENLQAVQTVEALEQAVSSLSAAVNLLTTKTSHRAAA